jgi:predicted MFS family arabinose efflux permease
MAANVTDQLWSQRNWWSEFELGKLMQARIWIGILIGSSIGGFIPELWGAGLISYSSIFLSGMGAVVGLLIGFKL